MKIPLIRWSQKCTGQNRTNAVQINRKFQKKCDLSSGNINSDCQRYQTDLIGIDLAAGSIFLCVIYVVRFHVCAHFSSPFTVHAEVLIPRRSICCHLLS